MKHALCFVFLISTLKPIVEVKAQDSQTSGSSDTDMNQVEYDLYKNKVCSLVPAFNGGGAGEGTPWSDVITEDDILELAFVNMAYGLTSDSVTHLKKELGWRKAVIDKISLITKATCLDKVISESFLNAAKNLFLYYMVKVQGNDKAEVTAANNTNIEAWASLLKSLQTCASSVGPIQIETVCGKAMSYTNDMGEPDAIDPVFEQFDAEIEQGGDNIGLDVVIDTVWWMFSTTYARCYAFFYPNEDEILLFFQMFREDFLDPFLTRWRSAGPVTAYFPIVFGPYDSNLAAENTRKCANAAFQYEDLAERQLVRPVNVMIDNNMQRNFKVSSI